MAFLPSSTSSLVAIKLNTSFRCILIDCTIIMNNKDSKVQEECRVEGGVGNSSNFDLETLLLH